MRSPSPLTCVWAQFQASSSGCSALMSCTSMAGSGLGGTLGVAYSLALSTISVTNGRSRLPFGSAGVNSQGKSG